jgi:hypothetical protein
MAKAGSDSGVVEVIACTETSLVGTISPLRKELPRR